MVIGAAGRPTRSLQRWSLLVGLLALGAAPAVAQAHAALVRAVPPARGVVRVPPRQAQLWFSEPLEPAYSTLSVWTDHTQVNTEKAAVSGENPRLLSVALPPLGRGAYVVKYRVLSIDGHVVEGRYSFRVGDGASRK